MYAPRIATQYKKDIVPTLQKELEYKSVMQVPRLVKIVLNQGLGAAVADKRLIDTAVAEMNKIAGQKAIPTYSKKDISNFKLRKGMPIGCKTTLRGNKMYEFLERLICISLPRIRDFKGVSAKGFDGRGNFTLGITEQIIFPEIDIDKVQKINGMDITFVISGNSDKASYALLKSFGIPFNNQLKTKKRN